jgi:hypothetical protein
MKFLFFPFDIRYSLFDIRYLSAVGVADSLLARRICGGLSSLEPLDP